MMTASRALASCSKCDRDEDKGNRATRQHIRAVVGLMQVLTG